MFFILLCVFFLFCWFCAGKRVKVRFFNVSLRPPSPPSVVIQLVEKSVLFCSCGAGPVVRYNESHSAAAAPSTINTPAWPHSSSFTFRIWFV